MIETILFDLDGTLLPVEQDTFTKSYFSLLANFIMPGQNPEPLISAVWAGTRAMIKNDGSRMNEEVFWETYKTCPGTDLDHDPEKFRQFYESDYRSLSNLTHPNPEVAPLIHDLKQAGFKMAVATNPLFPLIAQEERIRWTGANPEDFVYITAYENSRFCKPGTAYFLDLIDKIGAVPETTLMVGNDAKEDMLAEEIGARVFLLTDHLLNRENRDISHYPQGDFKALRAFIFDDNQS